MERYGRSERIARLVDGVERGDVSELALAVVIHAGLALLDNPIPTPTSSLDVARLAEAMATALKIVRLEAGESTSNALTFNVNAAELADLRSRIEAKTGDATQHDAIDADGTDVEPDDATPPPRDAQHDDAT